jgi:hypothetical protein
MTLLQFWLTVVFGATEIGFIASGIAAWYYRTELLAGARLDRRRLGCGGAHPRAAAAGQD